LIEAGAKQRTRVTKKLLLPDIEAEDLTIPRNIFSPRRQPIRRQELKKETVEIG
jgi:hypothetical protein